MIQQERPMIKFTFEEVECMLRLLDDLREMTEVETRTKEKLKRIYARQILSNERKINATNRDVRLTDTK